jgi:hypothetical protein
MLHRRLGRIRAITIFTWSKILDTKMGESMDSILVRWRNRGFIGYILTGTVGLGWQGTGVTLNESLVTMITSQNWIVGEIGLNPRPTNFTTFNDRATSLMTLLYEQNLIPSRSYGYNGGAKYRLNGVLGSLTLGGYDDSLYDPNENLTTGFYFDQTRDLTVGLQAIRSTTSSGNTSLLPTPDLYLIDSTVSQNYLAKDACAAFEKAFGLELNEETGLYLLNGSQHTKLAALNPNITFTLGALATGGATIDITFPYAAFDLNVSYPYNDSYYFPIVPATNSTQNTLGRQFLQEAYITVDYERGNFSVFPRKWSLNTQKHIVSITPPANSTETSVPGPTGTGTAGSGANKKKSSGIGTGAIVGIVVGVIAVAAIIGGLLFWRKQKKRREEERIAAEVAAAVSEPKDPPLPPDPYADTTSPGITELDSPEVKPPELHAEHYFVGAEMDSSQVVPTPEMEGDRVFYELEAPHGMHELPLQRPQQRHASDASTPTWKSRSPIRHHSDGGG